jgi:mannan endo-1,4-beta-mannosidase
MSIRASLVTLSVMGLVSTGVASAIEPVNPNLDATAREVLNYLGSIYQQKALAGYNVYVHTPDDYEQTGKRAAVWGRDIRWLGDPAEIAAHAKRHRYILTLHWHWYFKEDSAWTGKRKTPVDVGRVVTPGTPEHAQAMAEMDAAADKLQLFEDAGVPVLWRPLHEIDGGWFWWTDKDRPENTSQLWRMMFSHFTRTRKLDNLIWVYSAGVGKKTAEYRARFYPGADYVDISGIDVYGVEFREADPKYWEYYNVMSQVSPGKMLACGEGDAIPNPNMMRDGTLPRWLYALPWWGAPSARRPADWALYTMRHDYIVTLDELPAFGAGNIAPHVGILEPRDDGSAWYVDAAPVIDAYAVDRDGRIARVDFYAGDKLIGTDETAPYSYTWDSATAGCYDITAVAVDDVGKTTRSNNIRIAVGLVDLARGKPVTASSGTAPEQAVDGDYHSTWSSAKNDEEWIQADLEQVHTIDRINLMWGWKIHAADYTIQTATRDPGNPRSWTTVHTETDRPYVTWEATYRIAFAPTAARYVRLHATRRAGNQTWGGYQLAAMEVPARPASRETAGASPGR